jgi:chorismate mutase/prephenate dehydratase
MAIEQYRQRIDALDADITRLINERARCARAIGEAKSRSDAAAYAPDRELQVLDRIAARNEGPLPNAAMQAIYREIISACRALEKPLTVAYWGPPASNTHVAATRRFGSQAQFLETPSVAEVFAQVERGAADYGVVPVENSTEGVVSHSLDQFLNSDLQICAETFVPIQHNLLSHASSLREVRRVYTMFQATAQCRNWLSRHLPQAELIETTTTARAAEMAAGDREAGAIANLAAADYYGVPALVEHIEDNPRNRTRFWVIGRQQSAPSGRDKTSILFSVSHRPGALVNALRTFAEHEASLTFIESRPTKQTPWEYVFFIDVQGHVSEGPDSPLGKALPRFTEQCLFLRVLGSYPEAEDA